MNKDKLRAILVEAKNSLSIADANLAIFELAKDKQLRESAGQARHDLESVNLDKLGDILEELS